jgi:hypothetical protein
MFVMNAVAKGADYWTKVMTIGLQKSLVSYQEQTAIKQLITMAQTGNVPASSSGKVPSKIMASIKLALEVESKLEAEGIKIS